MPSVEEFNARAFVEEAASHGIYFAAVHNKVYRYMPKPPVQATAWSTWEGFWPRYKIHRRQIDAVVCMDAVQDQKREKSP